MSINPNSQYPTKTNPPDANYIYGSARNVVTSGDETGTPWEKELINDLFGMQQALLNDANIVPSGSADTVLSSQYLEAINKTKVILVASVSDMTAKSNLKVGMVIRTLEFSSGNGGGAIYEVISGTGTANGQDIIAHDTESISFSLVHLGDVYITQLGATTAIDNAAIINRAIVIADIVRTPAGEYDYNSPITLKSNLKLVHEGGGSWNYTGTATADGVVGSSLDNIKLENFKMTGTGASGFSNVFLTSCTRVTFLDPDITKAGSMGIRLLSCSNVLVYGGQLKNNYFYGIEDKLGIDNRVTFCDLDDNGDTGVATSTGGRGATIWNTKGCTVAFCNARNNTEYGLRMYSEAADSGITEDNTFFGNVLEDNSAGDIIIYSESNKTINNKIHNNVCKRTTLPSLSVVILCQGDGNEFKNNDIYATSMLSCDAYNLFDADNVVIEGGTVNNIDKLIGMSNSSIPNNCTIRNIKALAIQRVVVNIAGEGHVFDGIEATAAGTPVDAFSYDNIATGRNTIKDCKLDGFSRSIVLAASHPALSIIRVESKNTLLTLDLIKSGSDITGLELRDNNWADATSPSILQGANFPANPTGNFNERRIIYTNASPAGSGLVFNTYDMAYNNNATTGQKDGNNMMLEGWRCVNGGTDTWEPMYISTVSPAN